MHDGVAMFFSLSNSTLEYSLSLSHSHILSHFIQSISLNNSDILHRTVVPVQGVKKNTILVEISHQNYLLGAV